MSSTNVSAAATNSTYTPALASLGSSSSSTYTPQADILVPVNANYSHISSSTRIVLTILAVIGPVLALGILSFPLPHQRRLRPKKPDKTFSKAMTVIPDEQGSYTTIHDCALDEDRAEKPRSRRAPLLIIGGLLFGVAFASGHYGFYNRIDQQPVSNASVSQTWVIRLGTLLAWCVKLSLSVSIGVSFVQLQWTRLHRQPFKLQDIDSLSNILNNIFSFFGSSVWFRYPTLTLVALLCWVLPIIPVITPGTINVVPSQWLNTTHLQVPQLLVDPRIWAISPGSHLIQAAPELQRLITATAMLGDILPIQFSYPNATYAFSFTGPALTCQDANQSIVSEASLQLGGSIHPEGDNPGSPIYFATVPSNNLSNTFDQNFEGSAQCGYSVNDLDTFSVDQAHIYIVTNDGSGASITGGNNTVNVTDCTLCEALYSVEFNFINTKQTIDPGDVTCFKGMSFTSLGEANSASQDIAYAALMSGFGSLLIGSVGKQNGPTGDPNTLLSQCTSIEYLNLGFMTDDNILQQPDFTKNMQSGLEEMFRNILISLMSSPRFILPPTNASLGSVILETTINTYSYNSDDLLLTYGFAIFAALLCSALGFRACKINNNSYQNNISTFVRAMKKSDQIHEDDTGADPLPKDLGKTLMRFS